MGKNKTESVEKPKNNNDQKPEDVETVKNPKVTHQLKCCTICDYTTSLPRRTVCPAHPKIQLIPKTR